VAAEDSLAEVAKFADEVVCLATPKPFHAVGRYYLDFSSVSDEEVVDLLAPSASRGRRSSPTSIDQVRIPAGQIELEGDLTFPASAFGLVIFAHGSGSGRHSSRNRYVANILNQRRMVTLLFDLLTDDEDRARATRFDIPLLARRLDAAVQWAQREPSVRSLPIGLFGASTGAAAAIIVAAAREQGIAAVVSRGGRPDLAGAQALSMVRSHTLLIVGGADTEVLALNRTSQSTMGRRAELQVIPGATHLFEEPGTLEQAANAAADWFTSWLQPAPRVASSMRTRGC
jgi:dienelactone hydrolase